MGGKLAPGGLGINIDEFGIGEISMEGVERMDNDISNVKGSGVKQNVVVVLVTTCDWWYATLYSSKIHKTASITTKYQLF